jgi:molecular chaperone DnaJ
MPRDYYEILGVARSATEAELKKAYRQIAMKHHPDRNPGDTSAEERFKEANEAYAVLSDPEKRAHYDRFGTVAGGSGFDGDFSSLFEDLLSGFGFSGGRGRGARSRGQRGDDLEYQLEITLEEAASGVDPKIQVPRLETCETCSGNGAEPGSRRETCDTCQGRGEVRFSQGFLTVARTCSKCGGEGEVVRNPCKTCHGRGRVRGDRTLSVKVPAGIEDGMRMRLNGEGSGGLRGGGPGDLYVLVRVRPHERFVRRDADLYSDVGLTFPQIVLGTELDVPTLTGSAKLTVPAGTRPGEILRLRGKGMPHLRGRGRGDACYQVSLDVPTKLTAKQREALEAFDATMREEESWFKKLLG